MASAFALFRRTNSIASVGGDFAALLDRVATPGTGSFVARALGGNR